MHQINNIRQKNFLGISDDQLMTTDMQYFKKKGDSSNLLILEFNNGLPDKFFYENSWHDNQVVMQDKDNYYILSTYVVRGKAGKPYTKKIEIPLKHYINITKEEYSLLNSYNGSRR